MKQTLHKILMLIGAFALVTSFANSSFSQETDDAMDEFMNNPADEPPPAIDLPAEEEAPAAKPVVKEKAAKAGAKKPAKGAAPPVGEAEVVDMRLKAAPDAAATGAPAQPNPALDKVEGLMIADAELKVFMKAGGLRSKKIK